MALVAAEDSLLWRSCSIALLLGLVSACVTELSTGEDEHYSRGSANEGCIMNYKRFRYCFGHKIPMCFGVPPVDSRGE